MNAHINLGKHYINIKLKIREKYNWKLKKMLETILILVGLVVSFWAARFTFNQYELYRKYKHLPGPGIKSVLEFFIGNVREFSDVSPNGKCLPDKLLEM
jgi:hypothetical protein